MDGSLGAPSKKKARCEDASCMSTAQQLGIGGDGDGDGDGGQQHEIESVNVGFICR
jgi:hypothetical protein